MSDGSTAPLARRLLAQLLGSAFLATLRMLYPGVTPADAAAVVLPHDRQRTRDANR
jgi:hypothetical protein